MVPHGMIIGRNFRFFASVSIISSSPESLRNKNDKDITVWTWRWDNPIIPDITLSMLDEKSEKEFDIRQEGWVKVLRMNLYGSYACHKECAKPAKCPTLVSSEDLAYEMYKAWMDSEKGEKEGRFIISGRPGSGKSISSRIFTYLVNGTLCPYLNPTKPRVSFDDILDSAQFS